MVIKDPGEGLQWLQCGQLGIPFCYGGWADERRKRDCGPLLGGPRQELADAIYLVLIHTVGQAALACLPQQPQGRAYFSRTR